MPGPITVEIPAPLTEALALQKSPATLPRWVLEALVVEAVRQRLISRGCGGELLGLSFGEREEFYARHGVTYELSDEELAEDEEARDRMFKRR